MICTKYLRSMVKWFGKYHMFQICFNEMSDSISDGRQSQIHTEKLVLHLLIIQIKTGSYGIMVADVNTFRS